MLSAIASAGFALFLGYGDRLHPVENATYPLLAECQGAKAMAEKFNDQSNGVYGVYGVCVPLPGAGHVSGNTYCVLDAELSPRTGDIASKENHSCIALPAGE